MNSDPVTLRYLNNDHCNYEGLSACLLGVKFSAIPMEKPCTVWPFWGLICSKSVMNTVILADGLVLHTFIYVK